MRYNVLNSTIKNTVLGILITIMLFVFSACARKATFLTSSVVPAARGEVKVKKDKNNNYVIKVRLTNLAEVKRLEPAMQSYIVWMESDGSVMKNLGQINSSSGLLSKTLKASFEAVSASRPNKIFITAENEPNVTYPGSIVILSTGSF